MTHSGHSNSIRHRYYSCHGVNSREKLAENSESGGSVQRVTEPTSRSSSLRGGIMATFTSRFRDVATVMGGVR